MGAMLLRWLGRALAAVALALLAAYVADAGIYLLRGQPTGTVTVNRFLAVPLKGSRTEYDYQGSGNASCSRSLFPQGGMTACWRLRRNPNQFDQI